jgi:hypothetical protein
MGPTTTTVTLPPEMIREIRKKPVGSGGYQSLMDTLRERLKDSRLEVDSKLRDRIEHYAYDYGNGGWQSLLREILEQIERSQRQT